MICLNDKCYCSRSNKVDCSVRNVELCNNILCPRHCWEIPLDHKFPVCYADFSNFCTKYYHDLESAECPFCGSFDTKVTYHIKGRYFATRNGKALVDYIFRVTCRNCKSRIGDIRMNHIEKDDEQMIRLGKLAAIWKWNGYGKRKVDKDKYVEELEERHNKNIQFKKDMMLLKEIQNVALKECE